MRFWMFMKRKISSIKDIFPFLYLIFTFVKAEEKPSSCHDATQNDSAEASRKGGLVQIKIWNKNGWDLLSNQPFKSHTSCSNNLLHVLKVGNFHKVTFTFLLTLCTHCITDCHYRYGTSSSLEYISNGHGLSFSVYACIYSKINVWCIWVQPR